MKKNKPLQKEVIKKRNLAIINTITYIINALLRLFLYLFRTDWWYIIDNFILRQCILAIASISCTYLVLWWLLVLAYIDSYLDIKDKDYVMKSIESYDSQIVDLIEEKEEFIKKYQ